ncbi:MAG TPA: ABC transporter ATP-binding protein, partial [Usitatibacter sp.]|nr:ABC transporter ATP-binding protein [Usitatibacter sp.]
MSLLKLEQLHVAYGGIRAVKGIDLEVKQGELVCLIGANGAGKSTTLRAVTGLVRAAAGRITYDGQDISGLRVHEIARRGLALVPEGRGVFAQLTIEENLAMGAYPRSDRSGVAADVERAFTHFPRLQERRTQVAGTLSGGEQQMLAIGRALMSCPRLLLLDEPSLGLQPSLVKSIIEAIVRINEGGLTVLLVEQNVHFSLPISHRAYVLEQGRVVLEDAGAT